MARIEPCSFADCGSADARRYLPGWRCPAHTPAAVAGRAEPPPLVGPPWWIRNGKPIPPPPTYASWLTDVRAISSGRRRASTARWREARAVESDLKAREAARRQGRR